MQHGFGKIILFGEYAVLHGYSALILASNRRATASYQLFESSQKCDYIIRALPLGESHYTYTQHLQGPALEFAWKTLSVLKAPRGIYTIDSREFSFEIDKGHWQKLGLGSSAATTVALIRLVYALQKNVYHLADVYQLTQAIHHDVQGGLGSGADVAASVYGGLLRYSWQSTSRSVHTLQENQPVSFTSTEIPVYPLHTSTLVLGKAYLQPLTLSPKTMSSLLLVWTGKSASTTHLVRQVFEWADHHQPSYKCLCETLSKSSDLGYKAISQDCRDMMHHAVQLATDALQTLSKNAQVAIWTNIHAEIQALLSDTEAIVKPLGAGGGDLAWVMTPTDQQEQDAEQILQDHGWYCMRVALSS